MIKYEKSSYTVWLQCFRTGDKGGKNGKGRVPQECKRRYDISPRYLANIENKGQQPSLQIFYELVTRYHISVDQFFFPNETADKTTRRRQLDTLLDDLSEGGLHIVTETAKAVIDTEKQKWGQDNLTRVETQQTNDVCCVFSFYFGNFHFSVV